MKKNDATWKFSSDGFEKQQLQDIVIKPSKQSRSQDRILNSEDGSEGGFTSEELEEKSSVRWRFSMVVLIYGMIFNGTIYGYTSPALISLQYRGESLNASWMNLYLTDSEASWMSSITNLGNPLGTLSAGFAMNLFGRRRTALFLHATSYASGYALIAFARSATWLYAGRFLGGICQGYCNCMLYVYTLELCRTERERVLSGVLLSCVGYFGTVLTYVLGIFLEWRALAWVLGVLAVPYMVGIATLVPESPQFYLRKGDWEGARKCYALIYGSDYQAHSELNLEKFCTPSTCSNLLSWRSIKSIVLGTVLMLFYQFAGYGLIVYFSASILKQDEMEMDMPSSLDPALCASTLVALAGFIGVLISIYLVQKVSRKRLLLFSSVGTALSFGLLSAYYYCWSEDERSLLLPTLALISHLLLFSLGQGALTLPALTELIQPESLRPLGMAIVTTLGGFFAFINTKTFSSAREALGDGGTFLGYGVINAVGAVLIAVVVPSGL